jgi:signal peptidase I
MEPNLHHGQYLVVDKISYKLPFNLRSPQRGDVVVFSPPTQPNKDFVKRIIGLPDDTVEIKRGKVYINGEPLPNTFEARLDRTSMGPRTVPEGELFVMGDNRANSNDSRNWGMLEMDEVVGKAWLSYWPPQTWGVIPNDTSAASATLKSLFQQKEVEP